MASILLVEDDDDSREVIAEVLTMAGHQILEASDGVQALSIARDRSVDLVVTDILMPGKDGLETIGELRERFPAIKIIAMSGRVQRVEGLDYLGIASALGAHVVIRKPLDLDDLLAVVSRVAAA